MGCVRSVVPEPCQGSFPGRTLVQQQKNGLVAGGILPVHGVDRAGATNLHTPQRNFTAGDGLGFHRFFASKG